MQDRNDATSARSPAEHNEAHNHKVCGFNQYPFLLKRYNAQPLSIKRQTQARAPPAQPQAPSRA